MNYAPSNSLGFFHAFFASLSVIIVSELGDKTWFIFKQEHMNSIFLGLLRRYGNILRMITNVISPTDFGDEAFQDNSFCWCH